MFAILEKIPFIIHAPLIQDKPAQEESEHVEEYKENAKCCKYAKVAESWQDSCGANQKGQDVSELQ